MKSWILFKFEQKTKKSVLFLQYLNTAQFYHVWLMCFFYRQKSSCANCEQIVFILCSLQTISQEISNTIPQSSVSCSKVNLYLDPAQFTYALEVSSNAAHISTSVYIKVLHFRVHFEYILLNSWIEFLRKVREFIKSFN